VARAKLRKIIVAKQRERVGLPPLVEWSDSLGAQISELLTDYERHLRSRDRSAGYVRDTAERIRRISESCGWKILGDIRLGSFEDWFRGMGGAPKTRREYQLSIRAFANWLV